MPAADAPPRARVRLATATRRALDAIDDLALALSPWVDAAPGRLAVALGDDLALLSVPTTGGVVAVAHLPELTDPARLQQAVLAPLGTGGAKPIAATLPGARKAPDFAALVTDVLSGKAAIIAPGRGVALTVDVSKLPRRDVTPPKALTNLPGPKLGLVEDLNTSLGLIRSLVRSPRLRVERLRAGRRSHTPLAVLHLTGICRPHHVRQVRFAARRGACRSTAWCPSSTSPRTSPRPRTPRSRSAAAPTRRTTRRRRLPTDGSWSWWRAARSP